MCLVWSDMYFEKEDNTNTIHKINKIKQGVWPRNSTITEQPKAFEDETHNTDSHTTARSQLMQSVVECLWNQIRKVTIDAQKLSQQGYLQTV